MEREDLDSYIYQLKSVKEAYAADPTNSELINLKEELENLIALTKEYLDSQSAPAAPAPAPKKTETPKASGSSTPVDKKRKAPPSSAPAVSAGDEVTAKYRDGKFYPARVISISGSTDNPVYTVIFKGYTSSEVLGLGDVKALSVDKKRAMEISAEDAEREKKKKKYDKKQETRQQKNAEQNEKKASWQKFATKGAKKGISIPGVQGSSQFASPASATGRVGVVGSGKEMAPMSIKQKWQFERGDQE